MIVTPNPTNPIVTISGFMTQAFQAWAQLVTQQQLLTGTGSPETVVKARQGVRYMDDAGVAGAILYIKRDDAVAGDRSKGWILV